jgi:hypothetical protein
VQTVSSIQQAPTTSCYLHRTPTTVVPAYLQPLYYLCCSRPGCRLLEPLRRSQTQTLTSPPPLSLSFSLPQPPASRTHTGNRTVPYLSKHRIKCTLPLVALSQFYIFLLPKEYKTLIQIFKALP